MKKPLISEVRDQALHAWIAYILMLAFLMYPPLSAGVLVLIIAMARELQQHNWQGWGKLDMGFWLFGVIIYILIDIFWR